MLNTFKDLVSSIIGEYEPVSYTTSNGAIIIPNGLAGVDFTYVGALALLLIGVFCVFRLCGALIKR